MDLKFEHGWWMPKSDTHLTKVMSRANKKYKGRLTYQRTKFTLATFFVEEGRQRTAVDIGSNIGLWSYNMADCFDVVHCFEPIDIHRECWVKNLSEYSNLKLHPVALGNEDKMISMYAPETCTASAYVEGVASIDKANLLFENIEMKRLDSYKLEDVDFIKIDVQGYELNVVKGGKKTIVRNKPIIVLEQKDNTDAVKFLQDLGMKRLFSTMGDYCLGWRSPDKNDKERIYNYLDTKISQQKDKSGLKLDRTV